MRTPLVTIMLLAATSSASTDKMSGGLGYGRHALMPPRHDLRPPPLGADGAPIEVPDATLDDVPPDRSLPRGPQSTAARHANWCRTRHRSYDARTGTVARSDGGRVPCVSPFRGR